MANNQSNPNSTNAAGENPQKSLPATNGDAVSKAGLWQYLAEIVLAGAVGTGVWLFGEHLVSHGHNFVGSVVNFMAFCIYFATVPITTVKVWPHPKAVWLSFCGFCVLMALAFIFSSRPPLGPKTHFTYSLQIGDSPTSRVFLTNDFLFRWHVVKVGDLPNGGVMLNDLVNGCIVIPVQQGQSNAIFKFAVENDSALKVTDLEAIVGFPKDWPCDLDPAKWHKGEAVEIIPGAWKFEPTNMQYFSAQSPYGLFPFDTIDFPPITNRCTPEYIGQTFKAGRFDIIIRSTGFEEMLAANIVFFPVTSNSFKPFLTLGHLNSNGLIQVSPSQKEFEESQK